MCEVLSVIIVGLFQPTSTSYMKTAGPSYLLSYLIFTLLSPSPSGWVNPWELVYWLAYITRNASTGCSVRKTVAP